MPPLGHRRAAPSHGRPIYATVALWQHIDKAATKHGMSRSELVVRAVAAHLWRLGEPFPEFGPDPRLEELRAARLRMVEDVVSLVEAARCDTEPYDGFPIYSPDLLIEDIRALCEKRP